MRRWFLSYNSRDLQVVEALEAGLKRKDQGCEVFFAPKSQRAGGYWAPMLAGAIEQSTTFVFLVSKEGLGPWQVVEYYEALDKYVKAPDFPLVILLREGYQAPGLAFSRQLHWIITADPVSEQSLGQLMDAAAGAGSRPRELWRYTSPYRGLAAMTEADSDFFFGRTAETHEVLQVLQSTPNRMPILVGNSGVGKSSVAQAGVLASLMRQTLSKHPGAAEEWPQVLHNSRQWCFLRFNPGVEPLKALVEQFLRIWQLEPTDPLWEKRRTGWIELLFRGESTLSGLVEATERQYEELGQPKAPVYFLYIDQGEELYVRAEDRQRRRFSEVLASGLRDQKIRAVMSLRADFLGSLQTDEPLYAVHRQINIPPLRESQLREVVSRPAKLLSARFETDDLPTSIASRTAEESARDVGALPLLSYLLDEMWTQMVTRGDGVLRLPSQGFELGGVLAYRANAFLEQHPLSQERVRRILTLKLATVRADGEPSRRRALRSEFSDEEWRLVSELSDHPNRLLVTATPEGQESYVEVAHEAIFQRWKTLSEWVTAEREFLIWKDGLEVDRHRWETAPAQYRDSALLMGLPLILAKSWLAKRPEDLPKADREFINLSINREVAEQQQKDRLKRRIRQALVVALLLVGTGAGFAVYEWLTAQHRERLAIASRLATAAQLTMNTQYDLAALLSVQGHSFADTFESRKALWEVIDFHPRLLTELHHPKVPIRVAFSRDGKLLASSCADGTIRFWDPASFRLIGEPLQAHKDVVLDVVFSPDDKFLASASRDKTVRLWSVATRRPIGDALIGHTAAVASLAFSPDGKTLASASEDHTVRVWDLTTRKVLGRPLQYHGAGLPNHSIAFSPDGKVLALPGVNNTVLLWDVSKQKPVGEPLKAPATREMQGREEDEGVSAVSFSADRNLLAAETVGGKIQLWTVATRQPFGEPMDLGAVRGGGAIEFSPDGKWLASVRHSDTGKQNPNSIWLWDVRTRQAAGAMNHEQTVLGLSFSPDGKTLATASLDNTVRLWDVASPSDDPRVLKLSTDYKAGIAFSPNGKVLAFGGKDNTVHIWDLRARSTLGKTSKRHQASITSIAFNSDNLVLASGSEDRTIRLWNSASMQPLGQPLTGHEGPIRSIAFSPDGKLLASASADKTVRLWGVATQQLLGEPLRGHKKGVLSVAFSAEGKILASASEDDTIRMWDVATRKLIGQPLRPFMPAVSVAFDPKGQLLASAGQDGVWLWNTTTKQPTGEHLNRVGIQAVAFTPDGKTLALGGTDGFELLDVASRQTFAEDSDAGIIESVAFSNDGKLLAVAGVGDVYVWNVSIDSWVARLCRVANRNMSLPEWQHYVGEGTPYRRTCPDLPAGSGF